MEVLKDKGPSQIDTEIRCLAPEGGGSVAVMVHFLHMVDWAMRTCRDYELAQAYLALFLKVNHYAIYHVKPEQKIVLLNPSVVKCFVWCCSAILQYFFFIC